jgi:hypothetical protein
MTEKPVRILSFEKRCKWRTRSRPMGFALPKFFEFIERQCTLTFTILYHFRTPSHASRCTVNQQQRLYSSRYRNPWTPNIGQKLSFLGGWRKCTSLENTTHVHTSLAFSLYRARCSSRHKLHPSFHHTELIFKSVLIASSYFRIHSREMSATHLQFSNQNPPSTHVFSGFITVQSQSIVTVPEREPTVSDHRRFLEPQY